MKKIIGTLVITLFISGISFSGFTQNIDEIERRFKKDGWSSYEPAITIRQMVVKAVEYDAANYIKGIGEGTSNDRGEARKLAIQNAMEEMAILIRTEITTKMEKKLEIDNGVAQDKFKSYTEAKVKEVLEGTRPVVALYKEEGQKHRVYVSLYIPQKGATKKTIDDLKKWNRKRLGYKAFVPGMGQIENAKKGKGFAIMMTSVALAAGTGAGAIIASENYSKAQLEYGFSPENYQIYMDKYNTAKWARNISAVSLVAVYLYSTIDARSTVYFDGSSSLSSLNFRIEPVIGLRYNGLKLKYTFAPR